MRDTKGETEGVARTRIVEAEGEDDVEDGTSETRMCEERSEQSKVNRISIHSIHRDFFFKSSR
jgi:hypothetical protein